MSEDTLQSLFGLSLEWDDIQHILTQNEIDKIKEVYSERDWNQKLSLSNKIAAMPNRVKSEIFSSLSEDALQRLEDDWRFWARPTQAKAIMSEAPKILFIGGRGAGKTWCGAQWFVRKAMENPGCEAAILTRTAGDSKTVISAINEVAPDDFKPIHKKMERTLVFPNGCYAILTSSEKPDQLRGINSYFSWADETAFLKSVPDDSGMTALKNLFTATRKGSANVMMTTTPKKSQAMEEIIEQSQNDPNSVLMVTSPTFDNTALPAGYIKEILTTYEGTPELARQELYGEMVSSAGTVFTEEAIKNAVVDESQVPSRFPIRFIAVDPSVSDSKNDLCGICVVGVTGEPKLENRKAYILGDHSMQGKPDEWAKRVEDLCKVYQTKTIVYEKNQGGGLIRVLFDNLDPTLKTIPVHAARGKWARAEPVALALMQKRVFFTEEFTDLFQEIIYYNPETTKKSPDRMDAFVWAVTAGILDPPPGIKPVSVSSFNPGKHSIGLSRFSSGKVREFKSTRAKR